MLRGTAIFPFCGAVLPLAEFGQVHQENVQLYPLFRGPALQQLTFVLQTGEGVRRQRLVVTEPHIQITAARLRQ